MYPAFSLQAFYLDMRTFELGTKKAQFGIRRPPAFEYVVFDFESVRIGLVHPEELVCGERKPGAICHFAG